MIEQIHATLHGVKNRRNWYDCDCPFCGKEAKRGQTHFAYSETGYRCWVCGASGGLSKLAQHLRMDGICYQQVTPVERTPAPIARWRLNPTELLRRYQENPNKIQAWSRYKPVSAATVERFGFGFGRLPFQRADGEWYMSKRDWLIVPLYEHGQLVGLRGRNITEDEPKWISATGSVHTLWGVDAVQPGSICWLCENYVDAAWLMQVHPEWSAVAIGGASNWQPIWGEWLSERKPKQVVVILDNDLPGQATGALRQRLAAAWCAERHIEPPTANGPRIANDLRDVGVDAVLFTWPEAAPAKAGVDWILQQAH